MGSKDDFLGKLSRASKELVHKVQENLEEASSKVQDNLEEVAEKLNALLEGAWHKEEDEGFAEENAKIAAFVEDTEDKKLLAELLPTASKVSAKEYRLGRVIGRGSDDVLIYKAKQKKRGKKPAAIKRIPVFRKNEGNSWENEGISRLKRLVHEVIFLEELQHTSPHIVELHGAGKGVVIWEEVCGKVSAEPIGLFRVSATSEDRELWIVMEFVDGVDLSKLLEEDNIASLSADQLKAVFAFAARAVHVLHSRDIVHRDIKGSNLILSREGMVKVLDFDVACKLNEQNPAPTFLAGSPAYMAPEMVDSQGNDFNNFISEGNVPLHDFKVDIWALGMTLLELALGEEPVSTIAQDNYEMVSEYLSGIELEENQSAVGVVLNDFFAEEPKYVDRWAQLIGFEGRNTRDYTLERLHKDLANVSAIADIFKKEALENVNLVQFVAECLIMDAKLRPSAEELLKHSFVSPAMNELEALEKVLSKNQKVRKEDYPMTVKQAAALHYGYENFVF